MKPNSAHQCIRCDKHVYDVHTCKPSAKYKAGILEGLKMARAVLPEQALYQDESNIIPFMDGIDDLIKQYSGDE